MNSLHASTLSWVTLEILLDFTAGITVHFHPPIQEGGEASLSRLLPVAKLCQFFELATWSAVIR